ncbi:MAG: NAD(P)H-dependent amine dehydrogenase family protein [Candidatus Hodarchaeales archaeon]
MQKTFNVVQVGLGPMGKLIADLLVSRSNIKLLGVVDINPEIIGRNLSDFISNKVDNDLKIQSEISDVISLNKVDVVIIATSSSLVEVFPLIKQVISAGCNVVSLCEELSYPFLKHPKLSANINSLSIKNAVSVVGTGINPGYLMDLLPVVLTAPCQEVRKITVERMMNSSKRREPFQRKIGTALPIDIFHQKIDKKEITGHVGLVESIQMILSALGLKAQEIIEYPPEPIIAEEEFTTTYNEVVRKGEVCGLRSIAKAKDEKSVDLVILEFIAFSGDHEEFDSVIIEGKPTIHQKIVGGVHGDIGTAAMVANLIPIVFKAQPGLLTMKDLPVPRNTSRIFKK